jgi:histidinol dehydrogenase
MPTTRVTTLAQVTILRRVDLTAGLPADPADLAAVLPRAALDVDAALEHIRSTVEDVRRRGDAAVLDAAERFDGLRPEGLRVPAVVIAEAGRALDPSVAAAVTEAAARLRRVCLATMPADVRVEVVPGGTVLQRWVAVDRVGLYVPAGRVPLPSSVVMNVIPAQVAGVRSIAVASPPRPESGGWPHPVILGVCALLGIEEVYAAGGAQAVAMFAHGTHSCPRVDLVTGPGNVYVAAAKRLLRGVVGIDSEAGPTEIAILADSTADPRHVAADLVSQAEHDPMASCLLVTDSTALLDAVEADLADRVPRQPNLDAVGPALADQSAAVLVASLEDGLHVVDAWAAEHLQLHVADPLAVAARVRHAGAIFAGTYAPVSLGDYLAGSNHVLPTGGTARSSSGLGVHTFLRHQHVVHYTREALAASSGAVVALARAESLPAHAEAVCVRLEP